MNSAKCIAAVMCMLCLLGACCRQRNSAAPVSDKTPATTAAESLLFIDSGTTPPQKPKYDYIPDDGGLTFDLAALNERIHRQINAGEVPPWIYDYRYEEEYLFIFYGGPTIGTMVERFDTETSESILFKGLFFTRYTIDGTEHVAVLNTEHSEMSNPPRFPKLTHLSFCVDSPYMHAVETYRAPLQNTGYYTGENYGLNPESEFNHRELDGVRTTTVGLDILICDAEFHVPTNIDLKTEYLPDGHTFLLTVSGYTADNADETEIFPNYLIEEIQYSARTEHSATLRMKLCESVSSYSLEKKDIRLDTGESLRYVTCYELRFYAEDTNFQAFDE